MIRTSIAVKAVLLLVASTTLAVEPAAQRLPHETDIGHWLAMLADRDATVRKDAQEALMGLTPDDLPLLRAAVRAAAPLRPSQQAPLKEVVTYVVSRALVRQLPTNGGGVLGVWWPPDADTVTVDAAGNPMPGVQIDERFSGFVAYRYLQRDDLVLGQAVRGRLRETYTKSDLQALVRDRVAGDRITLMIRRAGRTLAIHLTLDARPVMSGQLGDPSDFENALLYFKKQAEAYFQKEFAEFVPVDDDA